MPVRRPIPRIARAASLVGVLLLSTLAHAQAVVRCSMMGDVIRKECCCPVEEPEDTARPTVGATPCCTAEVVPVTPPVSSLPRTDAGVLPPAAAVPVAVVPPPLAPPVVVRPVVVEHPPHGPPLILAKRSLLI